MNKYIDQVLSGFERNYREEYDAPTILIYHRVVELDSDPQLLTVKPRNFDEHMRYLQEKFLTISLQELVKCLLQGNMPKNAVVITFDDGYADNLHNAKPILEKYGVPATVFVSSGLVGSSREFWWDELERIFLTHDYRTKPLVMNGQQHVWKIDSAQKAREAYFKFHRLLKKMPHAHREQVIDHLFQWSGTEISSRDSHRPLTISELQKLALGGLIEIGAHTVNHVVLSSESDESQHQEIVTSKQTLENILGMQIKSFSYPFGGTEDVSASTQALVQQAGFNCGIANVNSSIHSDANLFWLPRRLVRDWNIRDFQAFMEVNRKELRSKMFSFAKKQFLDALDNIPDLDTRISNTLTMSENISKSRGDSDKDKSKKSSFSVLQINAIDNRGGAATIAYNLHTQLKKRGHNARMLVNRMLTNEKDIQLLPQVENASRWLLAILERQFGWLDLFHPSSFSIKRTDYFKESQILHLHNLHSTYFSYLALPELTHSKPTVWTLHDMQAFTGHCAHSLDCEKWVDGCFACPDLNVYPEIRMDTASLLWQLKKTLYADCGPVTIVCPSEWLRQKVQRSMLEAQRIEIIYNGVDEKVFYNYDKNYAKQKLQLPTDKLMILFSADGGTTNPWKGGDYIKDLYKQFRGRDDLLFVNLGGEQRIENNNWFDHEYIADKEKLALYYSAADLFLYPSIADTCPLTVLEALSCATPVLSFQTGGIPELVEHLETGYIAERGNLND